MKTLVIVTHPNLEASVINKRWVEELAKHPEKYTIHELHKMYPDGRIDVEKEQKMVESHGNLVLQFPVYWFNCPPLLKKWLDEVLTYGWAYGREGDKLKNRKTALAVTAGIKKSDYSQDGRYGCSLEQLLSPFETTFRYCNADYRSFYAFYGTEGEPGENVPGAEGEPPANELLKSSQGYLQFIDGL